MRFLSAISVASLSLTPAFAFAQAAHPAKIGTSTQGDILQTPQSQTLYVYDKDQPGSGQSNCEMTCAKHWPPFKASASDKASGDWSMIKRADGSEQWTYKGRPLYTFVKDKPNETSGKSYEGNSWHVAMP